MCGAPPNWRCVDLLTSATSCGACNTACQAGQQCIGGKCVAADSGKGGGKNDGKNGVGYGKGGKCDGKCADSVGKSVDGGGKSADGGGKTAKVPHALRL